MPSMINHAIADYLPNIRRNRSVTPCENARVARTYSISIHCPPPEMIMPSLTILWALSLHSGWCSTNDIEKRYSENCSLNARLGATHRCPSQMPAFNFLVWKLRALIISSASERRIKACASFSPTPSSSHIVPQLQRIANFLDRSIRPTQYRYHWWYYRVHLWPSTRKRTRALFELKNIAWEAVKVLIMKKPLTASRVHMRYSCAITAVGVPPPPLRGKNDEGGVIIKCSSTTPKRHSAVVFAWLPPLLCLFIVAHAVNLVVLRRFDY